MTGPASSSKLKRWPECIFGNDNCAYECGLETARRKLKTSHNQGWEQVQDEENLFVTCKGFAPCWNALLGYILDMESAVEPAKAPQINVTTRRSRRFTR